jgi:hypothetical protein
MKYTKSNPSPGHITCDLTATHNTIHCARIVALQSTFYAQLVYHHNNMTDEKNIAPDHRDADSIPEHIEHLDRTHTNKDVIQTTQESPYREVNFVGTYLAILLGCNAAFAGFLMPVTSLALIEAELGPSPNAVWVSLAWILLSAISFVLLGRLSDIFGRRWFWTGSAISALIGSIIGATANHIDTLIAASVFLGAASAAQLSFNICLGELVPLRHRFTANGIIFLSVVSRPHRWTMIFGTQRTDKTSSSSRSPDSVPTLHGC